MKATLTIPSRETGTDYVIYVERPKAADLTRPLPVMFFMDGDDQFSIAVDAYREVHAAGAVPAALLVGVGYGASYAKAANKRGRDYTPTAHSDEPTSGEAANFMRFLTETLWPELARRYRVDERVRGIGGHSLGSLLVLYALLQEPLFFTHYLASAPSIWWDDRSILRLAAERHARNSSLPARLFLSVGEGDSASMTGDLALLEKQFADKPFAGLDNATRRFAHRNHFNVLPDAFRSGLTTLLGRA